MGWLLVGTVGFGDSPSPPVEAQRPADGKLRIIAFGAHPDDAEIGSGGAAALWSASGHHVKLVSVTNGDAGHTRMTGPALAARAAEGASGFEGPGTTSQVLDIHDGELMPTMENRRTMTRLIRTWNADVVIAHRPNDYHPDHRYVGVLAQDSAFMVTVPLFCPDTPYLKQNPVFLYSYDSFERPNPFRPDIVVSIDDVIEKKLDALLLLESQFVEGGANSGRDPFPNNAAERAASLTGRAKRFAARFASIADRGRQKLIELYGEDAGRRSVTPRPSKSANSVATPRPTTFAACFPSCRRRNRASELR